MAEKTIIDYEQLQAIVQKMDAEGEAIAEILAGLRQLVHNMEREWIGAGANAFFDEMEMMVFPSMKRLSETLYFSSETARKIIGIYHNAESEAAAKFKGNSGSMNFGASQFGEHSGS